jgi:hypothetical protein
MAAKQSKTVDRQKIITKITKLLKKEYGGLPRKRDPLSVLETMLFAVCLEDASYDAAQTAFDRLKTDFFDWNEVRVSTITELEPTFEGLSDPARRAMRIRYLLYYVFDHQYSYDFETLKRKPLELVNKQLGKIKHLTPFARNFLLQNSLGTHVLPLDDRMLKVAIYLGLVPGRATVSNAPELLKAHVRKADGLEFGWLLKSVSVSSKADVLLEMDDVSDGAEISDSDARLADLQSGRLKRRVQSAKSAAKRKAEEAATAKAAAKKAAAAKEKKKAARDAASKKAVKKTAKKVTKKKTAAKAAKKTAAKKTAAKKTAAKKKAVKKVAKKKAKKTTSRKKK